MAYEAQRSEHRAKVEELTETIRSLLACNQARGCGMRCIDCLYKKARGSKLYGMERQIENLMEITATLIP